MTGFPKPRRGEYRLEQHANRQAHKSREQAVMQAALKRDSKKCRVPRCPYGVLKVDPCHLEHRGMGGNPKEDRTELDKLISLCRRHHEDWDKRFLDIEPLTEKRMSGPCAFYIEGQHFATEKWIGVSETRGQ